MVLFQFLSACKDDEVLKRQAVSNNGTGRFSDNDILLPRCYAHTRQPVDTVLDYA